MRLLDSLRPRRHVPLARVPPRGRARRRASCSRSLIVGWTATVVLAITPLVIFVLVGFRGATGLVARVDAALARGLIGVDVRPPISSGGSWFWGRGRAVLADGASGRSRRTLRSG